MHFHLTDVQEIPKIRTSPQQREDLFACFLKRPGLFYTRSTCHIAAFEHYDKFTCGSANTRSHGDRSVWNLVWCGLTPPKMKKTISGVVNDVSPTNLFWNKGGILVFVQPTTYWYKRWTCFSCTCGFPTYNIYQHGMLWERCGHYLLVKKWWR